MDWILLFIAVLLVFTGAAFFGYPIGYAIGRHGWNEAENSDALHAEIIEEVKE